MKNPNEKNNNKMKTPAISITATLVESKLLTNLVEKLAVKRYDAGYSLETVQHGWEAIEISSIEAHVSGITRLSTEKDKVKMVFNTCFLFTCTKGTGKEYNLTWVNSLS